jgi:unspecific monooxygenase
MSIDIMKDATDPSEVLPPGPDLPGWRVAQLWIERPVAFWEECAGRYGDAFTIELGLLGTTVVFGHPEAARQVFQLPPESYVCRPYNDHYKYVMGEKSPILADGDDHRQMRRRLMPALHGKLMKRHGEAVRGLTRAAVSEWPAGQPFSPRPSLHLLFLRVMLRVLFGGEGCGLSREIDDVFSRDVYRDLGSWSVWSRFSHLQPKFRRAIAAEAAHRRGAPAGDGSGLFDALVQARDGSGGFIADDEIQDQVFTMLVAGVDTSAIAVAWALYWVHEDPGVLARLRRELAGLGHGPDALRVGELPYLGAVCQETLRMFPVVATPSGRKLVAPAEVAGRRYDPGVTLLPSTYLVHRRAELYPEPHAFRPERFLERQYGPHEYFPFGGGARACVGASLASTEMRLALAEILSARELRPAHEGPVEPVRHGTLLAPSDGLKFVASPAPAHAGVVS